MELLTLLLAVVMFPAGRAIVLPAPPPGEGAAALIIVQGADVYPEQYIEMGSAIQNVSSMPLWVGICEGFLANYPNPLQISQKIADVMKDLTEAGMPEEAKDYMFVAAHSLGGVVLQGYVDNHAASLRGVMLWGSYLTSRPLATYPLPILHLSGSLDGGQARPTRMAQTYAELQDVTAEHPEAWLLKPVIILEAVDHAHFFSGEIPPEVAKTDIKSELDPVKARDMLAARCAAFLAVAQNLTESGDSRELLKEDFTSTGEFLSPLFSVQNMEAEGDGSEWSANMQNYMLNVADESVSLDVTSVHEPSLTSLGRRHPSCTGNESDPMAASISIYSSVEHPLDPVDASPNAITSSELAIKMISQNMLKKVVPDGSYGSSRTCKDLNQETLKRVLSMAPEPTRERFDRRGKPVTFKNDHVVQLGTIWSQERLRLTYADPGLTVQSVAMTTGVDSVTSPGSYLCKLLAPSRALEYILTDGLRGTAP